MTSFELADVLAEYPGRLFDEVAAVTDLYLCATPPNARNDSTKRLEFTATSRCAKEFMARIVAKVRPKAIITKGSQPMNYFLKFVGPCEYGGSYLLEIEGFVTTLLPLSWSALNGTAREPHKTLVVGKIAELDRPESVTYTESENPQ